MISLSVSKTSYKKIHKIHIQRAKYKFVHK